ncbi:MAG: nucleotide pyrophosphohydrolase [Candidatus Bathyarchaeota archaeon]|nr:nucleotide pyrophosphohydrolase [Candidatus Bathyarchaeum sp.]
MHIHEFQKMMRQLYFERDTKRGTKGTTDWLADEVEELKEALEEGDRNSAAKEFADVLAWLASLANIVDIDLESAALTKYNNKCPKCGLSPCNCKF